MRKALFICFIITCAISSCVKAPQYPDVPQIKFVSVSSSYVTSGNVDTITFSFTDGNGDIAPNTNDSSNDNCIIPGVDSSVFYNNYYNIFLFKSNDNFGCSAPDVYASPNLVPTGTYKALSGQIVVYEPVRSYACFTCDSSCHTIDSVIYTIYLIDLNKHLSNAIKTSAIYITCQ